LATLKWLQNYAPAVTLNAQAQTQAQIPEEDPHWDPNDDWGYQWLEPYHEALLGGLKEGGKKAMNMSKTSEVLQGPDESPSLFYEYLCEAFHLYIPSDPETIGNQWMINAAFVGQA
jgi:hypothetical protein